MRRERSILRAAVTFVVAVSMVAGLVPAPALAEAVEEVSAVGERADEAVAATIEEDDTRGLAQLDGWAEEDSSATIEGAEADGLPIEENDILPNSAENETDSGDECDGSEMHELVTQSASVADPRVAADSSKESGQVATWDCVWLGSYPQSEIADEATASALDTAGGWNASGDLVYGGVKYRRVRKSNWGSDGWAYYRWTPIKWRVLETDGKTALVLSDVALDSQCYNNTSANVTWATCSLRYWLNDAFWNNAFTPAQQIAVKKQTLVNEDNSLYGTDGGTTTTDAVFLLSETDLCNTNAAVRHGFVRSFDTSDEARRCDVSGYAREMGAGYYHYTTYLHWDRWWVRGPGQDGARAICTTGFGNVARDGTKVDMQVDEWGGEGLGVRPAMRIDLTSCEVTHAGVVSSNPSSDNSATERPRGRDLSGAVVTVSNETYTGKALKPTPVVRISGEAALAGSDYSVTYANNVNVGTATVTVRGRGAYTGSKTVSFTIAKAKQAISATDRSVAMGKTVSLGARLTAGDGKLAYASSDATVATVSASGVVTPAKVGTCKVTITAAETANWNKATKTVTVTVKKGVQPMKLKAVKRAAKLAKVKKKAVTVAAPLKFTKKAQGKVTYAKVAKGSAKCLTVNKKTGKVTVKKGTKKGTYKVKIKVTAKGNANYKAGSKTVTCKVVVK